MSLYNDAIEPIVVEIIIEGLDDWVPLHVIDYLVLESYTEVVAEMVSLEVIRGLVATGLIEIGEIVNGFRAWELPLPESLNRVLEVYRKGAWENWAFACWIRLTDKGKEVAKNVFEIMQKRNPDYNKFDHVEKGFEKGTLHELGVAELDQVCEVIRGRLNQSL
jgi:hypothetical protein